MPINRRFYRFSTIDDFRSFAQLKVRINDLSWCWLCSKEPEILPFWRIRQYGRRKALVDVRQFHPHSETFQLRLSTCKIRSLPSYLRRLPQLRLRNSYVILLFWHPAPQINVTSQRTKKIQSKEMKILLTLNTIWSTKKLGDTVKMRPTSQESTRQRSQQKIHSSDWKSKYRNLWCTDYGVDLLA